jgi:6-phosphogluconolactonase (cycloisomerase 2 family)
MKSVFPTALLALAATAASASVASASPGAHDRGHASSIVGHVYVNDNTAGSNTVAGFDRHADGTLTPIPGSPFATGGAGTGTGVGSQGALQQSPDGRYLLAVDAGSSEISVLRVRPDGSLGHVGNGTVSSNGVEPVSVTISGSLVYVANAGAGGSNYTGFTLNPGGQLRPLSGSTVALPTGSSPGDILFNGDGTKLVGTRIGTSLIDSFAVVGGRPKAAPGSPFAAQGPGPFGSEFRPTNTSQLFVSNAHGGPGAGTVSAFDVAGDGTLSSIGSSPFADLETAPCWVEISHDGRFLFTTNTASNTVSRYAIAPGGSLELLGSTPFKTAHANPFDARLSPDGTTLWTVDTGTPAVSAFAVDGGNLTELSGSPTALPANAAPFGIVVD